MVASMLLNMMVQEREEALEAVLEPRRLLPPVVWRFKCIPFKCKSIARLAKHAGAYFAPSINIVYGAAQFISVLCGAPYAIRMPCRGHVLVMG